MSEDATDAGGSLPAGDGVTRTATVRTTHADADRVAAALAPDNTDSMDTSVDGDAITCTIERETTGGLLSTVDDYVVNLTVADRVTARGRAHEGASRAPTNDTSNI